MLDNVPSRVAKRAKDQPLSIEEHVRCLIDIATDRHVLGVLFCGYHSWF